VGSGSEQAKNTEAIESVFIVTAFAPSARVPSLAASEQLSKAYLGQTGLLSRLSHVGHINHAAKLATLDFSNTLEDLHADVT